MLIKMFDKDGSGALDVAEMYSLRQFLSDKKAKVKRELMCCSHIYAHTHTRTHIHAYTHTHTHRHTDTQTHRHTLPHVHNPPAQRRVKQEDGAAGLLVPVGPQRVPGRLCARRW